MYTSVLNCVARYSRLQVPKMSEENSYAPRAPSASFNGHARAHTHTRTHTLTLPEVTRTHADDDVMRARGTQNNASRTRGIERKTHNTHTHTRSPGVRATKNGTESARNTTVAI